MEQLGIQDVAIQGAQMFFFQKLAVKLRCQSVCKFCQILSSSTETLPNSTNILPNSTKFYPIPSNSTKILPIFTKFHRILPKFYQILPNSTKFYQNSTIFNRNLLDFCVLTVMKVTNVTTEAGTNLSEHLQKKIGKIFYILLIEESANCHLTLVHKHLL